MIEPIAQARILEGLNEPQLAAVTHGEGPQLVVAGAGTGKTSVITRRIAYLVAAKLCTAREILGLTFTDKAAMEMESRVDVLVPYGFTDSTICTFHAFGDRALREQGVLLGMNPDFRVLSTAEQLVFLREHLFELPLQRLRPLADPTRNLEVILKIISRAKDEDVGPQAYLAHCRKILRSLSGEEPEARAFWDKQMEIASVYAKVQELLTAKGLVDFGDLITLTLELLRSNPDVLREYRQRYRYLLVDEFQDTNAAQFELIKLLAGEAANLTVVGDDDQSIYKFRGAAVSNILQFTRDYPRAKLRLLNENYRSTQMILDTAYRLIRHNDPERLEIKHGLNKRLISVPGDGLPVRYQHFENVSAEADWVAGEIWKRHTRQGRPWSDFAVLVRANRQADPFLRALNLKEIPVRFSGSQGLYQRPEVRLCISFLRALSDPANSLHMHDLAASELYALPAEDLALLAAFSRRTHVPLAKVMQNALADQKPEISMASKTAAERLLSDFKTYLDLARNLPTGQLLYRFLSDSGLLGNYTHANTLEADFAIKNLAKFFNLVQRYEQVAKSNRVICFVQHLDMLTEAGDDPSVAEVEDEADAVTILTVHRAKGLEFPVVFMVELAANRFPPIKRNPMLDFPAELAKEDIPQQDSSTAEERRLFYVGMTRAKKELLLSSAKDYGGSRSYKPSRFVLEALELPQLETRPAALTGLEGIRSHAEIPAGNLQPPRILDEQQVLALSFYQIDDYLTCPLKYKYIHILQIPILPHHSIVYGNAMHTAAQAFFKNRLLHKPDLDEEKVVEIFKHAWVNEGFISREHEEIRLQTGLKSIHHLLERERLIPSKPKYIEKSFSFTLGSNRIVGRIDRIDDLEKGGEVIIDFKTSEVSDVKAADKKAKDSLQLKIYATAWLHTEGRIPERLELHFLDSGIIGRTMVDEQAIGKTEELIRQTAGEIRRQIFDPKPSPWTCNYCSYRTICPHAEA